MEAVRISFAGFLTRKPFDEFVDRFGLLVPEALDGSSDEVNACKRILEKIENKGYQIGKTKVFLQAGQMAELETRRSEVLGKSASIIQRKFISYLTHRNFILLRLSARQIQAACRGHLAQQVYKGLQREASSLMIQTYYRMHISRKAYTELYSSAVSIQTGMQGMAAGCDLRFRKQKSEAIVIQFMERKSCWVRITIAHEETLHSQRFGTATTGKTFDHFVYIFRRKTFEIWISSRALFV